MRLEVTDFSFRVGQCGGSTPQVVACEPLLVRLQDPSRFGALTAST